MQYIGLTMVDEWQNKTPVRVKHTEVTYVCVDLLGSVCGTDGEPVDLFATKVMLDNGHSFHVEEGVDEVLKRVAAAEEIEVR